MTEDDVRVLAEVSQRAKSNTHQIEEIKGEIKEIRSENKAIYELTSSVKIIANDMGTIKEGLSEVRQGQKDLFEGQDNLSKKIVDIENKPAREAASNWSKIKVAVATSVITAIVMGVFYAAIAFVK